MKKIKIVILCVVILVVILLIGVEIFLRVGMAPTIKKVALPVAEEVLGVSVEMEDASASLFAGTVSVSGVKVGNPQGFSEPVLAGIDGLNIDAGLLTLSKSIVTISKLDLDNANVTVARNKEGKINALEVYRNLSKEEKEVKTETEEKTSEPSAMPKAHIKKAELSAMLEYIDHKVRNAPLKLAWKLNVEAHDIKTFGKPEDEWGTFSIKGHLREKPDTFVMNLKGKLAPFTDPERPSFDLEGDIVAIDLAEFKDLTDMLGFTGESADIKLFISKRNGVVQEDVSKVTITLNKVKPVGKLEKQLKDIPLPENLTLTVPYRDNPVAFIIDAQLALLKSLTGDVANLIKGAADKALKDPKVDKAIKDGKEAINNLLGGFLGKKKDK